MGQLNLGSGDSDNSNCGQNEVDNIALACGIPTPTPTPLPPGTRISFTFLGGTCSTTFVCPVADPPGFVPLTCFQDPCRAFLRTGGLIVFDQSNFTEVQAVCTVR